MPKGIYKRTKIHRLINSISHHGLIPSIETKTLMSIAKKDKNKTKMGHHIKTCRCCACKGARHEPFTEKHKENLRKVLCRHHKYLKQNSKETILLSRRDHNILHHHLYEYVYSKFGKKEIDKYIKWAIKKFKIKVVKDGIRKKNRAKKT